MTGDPMESLWSCRERAKTQAERIGDLLGRLRLAELDREAQRRMAADRRQFIEEQSRLLDELRRLDPVLYQTAVANVVASITGAGS